MNQLFQYKEIKRYYSWSLWTKPLLIYSLIVCFLAVTFTTCALLVLGNATIDQTSAIFITIIGAISPVLAIIYGGRAYERSKGIRGDDDFAHATVATNETESSANQTLDPFNSPLSSDPLTMLRSLDLSDYEPRIADDHPQIE